MHEGKLARIATDGPVVPEDEVGVGGDYDRIHVVPVRDDLKALTDFLAVDDQPAIHDRDVVTRQAHDALHEVHFGIEGILENHQVVAVHLHDFVAQPIHHQPIAVVQGWLHGMTPHH